MYQKYWSLTEQPFRNTFSSQYFFYSSEHEEALVRMLLALTEAKGLMALTGPAGIGKTFSARVFSHEVRQRGYPAGMIVNPALSPVEFLQETVYALGIEFSSQSKVELLRRLEASLRLWAANGAQPILIVDEAQLLNQETLEEVRLLLNLESEQRPLLTVYLVGQTELWENLNRSPMLLQRVGVAYRMKPLSQQETARYLQHRAEVAGANRPLFTAQSCELIHAKTGGVAREINDLANLCLLVGSGHEAKEVDAAIVREAAKESVRNEMSEQSHRNA